MVPLIDTKSQIGLDLSEYVHDRSPMHPTLCCVGLRSMWPCTCVPEVIHCMDVFVTYHLKMVCRSKLWVLTCSYYLN